MESEKYYDTFDRPFTDAYIPLLEAASGAVTFYVQIGTVPSELIRQPEPMNRLARDIAKLNVIASKEVMEAMHGAQKSLTLGMIKLFQQRIVIEGIISSIASIESQIQFFQMKNDSFNQRFEKHIDAGTGANGLRDVLIRLMNENWARIQQLNEEKSKLTLKKAALELSVTRQAVTDLDALRPQGKAALVAIRKDIDLPIDEKWLTELFDTNSKDVLNAIESFHGKIEIMIAEAEAKKTKD